MDRIKSKNHWLTKSALFIWGLSLTVSIIVGGYRNGLTLDFILMAILNILFYMIVFKICKLKFERENFKLREKKAFEKADKLLKNGL